MQAPMLTYDQIKFFIERFTHGNFEDPHFRRTLTDTFINKIELFDNHVIISYNAYENNKVNLPLEEPSVVLLREGLVEHTGFEPVTPTLPVWCASQLR